MMNIAILNERIAAMRNLRGLTLDQLAEKVGVKNATISRYEHGDIKTLKSDMIIALAQALGCSPVYLMGWTDDMQFRLSDSPQDHLSKVDRERLRKFHALSERDQQVVDRVLECAYQASVSGAIHI